MMMEAEDVILSIQNVSKRFPGVLALNDISFDVKQGQIHALVGENGAGKSTLIKILSGSEALDSGKIMMNGSEMRFVKPLEAIKAGISVVHQEIRLVEELRVAENIFIGRPQMKKSRLIDFRKMNALAREMLDSIGAHIIDGEIFRFSI